MYWASIENNSGIWSWKPSKRMFNLIHVAKWHIELMTSSVSMARDSDNPTYWLCIRPWLPLVLTIAGISTAYVGSSSDPSPVV